eukprot:240914-Chlamydomonas_euryale.AAC.2
MPHPSRSACAHPRVVRPQLCHLLCHDGANVAQPLRQLRLPPPIARHDAPASVCASVVCAELAARSVLTCRNPPPSVAAGVPRSEVLQLSARAFHVVEATAAAAAAAVA